MPGCRRGGGANRGHGKWSGENPERGESVSSDKLQWHQEFVAMANRQQINKAIERIRGELRGLVDTDDGQGFIIAVNDGASSTVCATGKPEALVAVVTTMATEPAIREVFEEAARQCSSRWPSAPPDVSGSGSET